LKRRLVDDFNLRIARAALEGAVSGTDTLSPLVAEAVKTATDALDATQKKIEAPDGCQQPTDQETSTDG
jgi:hypothetical protein